MYDQSSQLNSDGHGSKVSSLIYPIPPKKGNYFLGVHLTKTTDGVLKFGPSAIPALYREQYGEKAWSELGKKEVQEFASISKQLILNGMSPKLGFYL